MRIDVKGSIIATEDKWIYELFDMESTCPKDVFDSIQKANGQPIDIYISSGGGDLFAGVEIYSELRNYTGQVKIHITGNAASAASIIAMAGESDISPAATIMIHCVALYGVSGNHNKMDGYSDLLKTLDKSIAQAYMEKTGKSEADILDMLDKETWLTSTEAVEQGFINGISVNKNIQYAASNSCLLPLEVINKMRNERKYPQNQVIDDVDIFMNKIKIERARY